MASGNSLAAESPSKPVVSVIVNCYNGAKYLRQAIDSVLAQTYPDWELIFWDNQSTDESADIIRGYGNPKIKYFYAPEHTLLYEARNYALEKASGEFLAFLDVDDLWMPNKLEMQIPLFADPAVGMVCGNYWVLNERSNKRKLAFRGTLPTGRVLNDLLKFYFVGLVTLVIRKTALTSMEYGFDPRYHIIGDLDLVTRLSTTWNLGCVQESVAVYRVHGDNESAKNRPRHADELELWSNEMKHNAAIMNCRDAHFIRGHFLYIKAVNFILAGNKKLAYPLMSELPWGRLKLRLWAAMLAPAFVVRRTKN